MVSFTEWEQKIFTIYMETQKSPYRQSDLAKKNGAGGINLPDFRLHSKATLIRQYETGRKTEI